MRLASIVSSLAVACCLTLVGCGPTAPRNFNQDAGADAGAVPTTLDGGVLPSLYFAIVGDTRPQNIDDTGSYPTPVITQIYSNISNMSPRPAFVVTTGDYMYASTTGTEAEAQLTLYSTAASQFPGKIYSAMGNHECTGFTSDNCDLTQTANYAAFMKHLVTPLGEPTPYYSVHFAAPDGSWTAKVVVTACNAWDSNQQSWLQTELSQPTTYTFAVRHEDPSSPKAPCIAAGIDSLLQQQPHNILIVGHLHSYSADPTGKVLLVGNGGAGSSGYGYATVQLQPGTGLVTTEYAYDTGQPLSTATFQ